MVGSIKAQSCRCRHPRFSRSKLRRGLQNAASTLEVAVFWREKQRVYARNVWPLEILGVICGASAHVR
jgi:hypothetical protein